MAAHAIKSRRPATAFDVARAAGVSRATVSRAFDENGPVEAGTRVRVLAAAAELNYQPHPIARSLNRRQSDLVAIIVDNLRNPFEAEIYDLLVSRLTDMKLQPLLVRIADKSQAPQRLRTAAGYQVAAAVSSADCVTPEIVRASFGATTPIIMMSGPIGAKVDTIRSDPRPAVEEFVKLTHKEHKRFGFLAGRQSSSQSRDRGECLRAALRRRGKSIEAVADGDFTYESGYRVAVPLLRSRDRVDCLVAANDAMAMGAMDAARHVLGLRVPDDLSIVGFDGIEPGSWQSYDLTTMTATIPAMAQTLLDCLVARRADPDRDAIHHALPTQLVRRSSARLG